MDVAALEAFLRPNFEALQYLAFFGVLAVCGAIETVAARRVSPGGRLRRWPANWAITVLNIVILGALPLSVVAAADYAHAKGWGALNAWTLAPVTAFAIGFLLRAFLSWATHFAMHKVPLFWRVHRVHHTDTALDVSTTVRFHPLEFVITTPLTIAGAVAFGLPPGALMAYEVADAAITMFSHANIRLPRALDATLRIFVVTPDVHRVHHSTYQPETDSNFGAVLTIWDRVLGTYCAKAAEALAEQPIGLDDCDERHARSLMWMLVWPFIETQHNGRARPQTPTVQGTP